MGNAAATASEKAARPRPAALAPAQWPANQPIEQWAADKLRPHPDNVRRHPVAQLLVLDESFAEHGVVKPFVINGDGLILAGHGGCLSVDHLHGKGITLPCIVVRGWTPAQERAFMIRDNATAERSSWDKPRLAVQLAGIKADGYPDASRLGLKPAILKSLAGAAAPRPGRSVTTQPAAEAAPIAPISRTGDVWQLGEDRVSCLSSSPADLSAIDAMLICWEGCAKKIAILAATGEGRAAVAEARQREQAPPAP